MKVEDIPLGLINVPDGRFRSVEKTLASRDGKKQLEDLLESIKKQGLIHPILVDTIPDSGRYNLVAGEHRLWVFNKLKLPTIPSHIKSELSDVQLMELELDENVHRLGMSAADRVNAIAAIHKLKRKLDPNWTQAQTAEKIGLGSRRAATVSQAIALSEMAEAFPELKKAKSINQMQSWANAKAGQALRVDKVQRDAKTNPRTQAIEEKIWLGDSVDRIKEVPDHSFRLVLTDPPFGVDYDVKLAGHIGSLTDYSDTVEDYERILSMAPDLYRVIKPDGFLVWFFGISHYELCKKTFRDAGFDVDEIPVVWNRSAGKCWTQRPDRFFARAYDVALMCRKGDPQIIERNQPNVINVAPIESHQKDAAVERPIELYRPFIERLTVRGEKVADFFCGAGGVPAGCAQTGRDFFAIERNPARRAIAISKVLAHLPS